MLPRVDHALPLVLHWLLTLLALFAAGVDESNTQVGLLHTLSGALATQNEHDALLAEMLAIAEARS